MGEPSVGDEPRDDRAAPGRGPTARPTYVEAAYLLAVAGLATFGFAVGSTATILVATLVALPTGLAALVGYYVVYGLAAQVPGANPDSASGWVRCSPDGSCHGSTTGDAAAWLTVSTSVVGVVLLVLAAAVNIVLVRLMASRRRSAAVASTPGPTGSERPEG